MEGLSRGAVGRATGRDVFENINLPNRDQTGKQRKQAEVGVGARLEGRTRAAHLRITLKSNPEADAPELSQRLRESC